MKTSMNPFVVADPQRCIGCQVCELACAAAHSDHPAATVGALNQPILPRLFLVKTAEVTMPIQCRQCEDAPCANVCPVGAIRQEDGRIQVQEQACVGCKTCLMACPFGAMELVPRYRDGRPVRQEGLQAVTPQGVECKDWLVAHKCDLCHNRPTGPACVTACPQQALKLVEPAQERRRRNIAAARSLAESVKKYIGS